MRTDRTPSKATITNKTSPAGSFSSSWPGRTPSRLGFLYAYVISLMGTMEAFEALRQYCAMEASGASQGTNSQTQPGFTVLLRQFSALAYFSSRFWYEIIHNMRNQKPNSWTYNFIEVSGHNLESSQTLGFCMDFLNCREGGMVFDQFSFFLLYRNCKRLREFKEIEISRQICRGDCESQGGKLLRVLSAFRPRIRPLVCF